MKKIIKQIQVILLLCVFCSFGNKVMGQSIASDNHPMGYSRSVAEQFKASACTPPDLYSDDATLPRKDAVDMASYQSWMTQADFNQLKAQGVKTVVIKLTEGTTYKNPYAVSQIQMAQNAGLGIAVYHFADFGSTTTSQTVANGEAAAEAAFFAQTAKSYGIPAGAAMILDAEMTTDGNYGIPTGFSWTSASLAFANQLKIDNYPNVKYYTSGSLAVDYTNGMEPRIIGVTNIWMSGYPCTVSASSLQYTQYGAWQYSSSMYFRNFSANNSVDVSIDYTNLFSVLSDSALALLQTAITTSIPRIYASELSAVLTDAGYDLSFTLNTNATNVDIILQSSDKNDTLSFGAFPQGRNTVSVSKTQAPEEQCIWSVTASADPISTAGKFTDETSNQELNFNSAHGVSIDNNFDSPYFGRIYVTSNGATGASFTGRTTSPGIYILDAALSDVTGQGDTPYTGNIAWYNAYNNVNSPNRCCVAPDGQLYIADFSSFNSGVYVMDPANPDSTFRTLFPVSNRAVSGLIQYNGVYTAGSVVGICVTGSGDSTKLFTIDKDYGIGMTNPLGLTKGYDGLQYNIGTSTTPWTTTPSAAIFNNATAAAQYTGNYGALLYAPPTANIASDSRGGFFISQNRSVGQDNQAIPSLIHISPNSSGSYSIDFNSGDPVNSGLIGGSLLAGLAVSYDGSMLAANISNEYKIFNVIYDTSDAPTLTMVYDITTPNSIGDAYSMVFDKAGNLYVITTTSTLGGYSFPTADNTFTTPAPSSQALDFANTGITVPKQSPSMQVYPNPVLDVVHVDYGAGIESVRLIDLAGRIILNVPVGQKQPSMEINLSGVPAGNYILMVNNMPVKMEKK